MNNSSVLTQEYHAYRKAQWLYSTYSTTFELMTIERHRDVPDSFQGSVTHLSKALPQSFKNATKLHERHGTYPTAYESNLSLSTTRLRLIGDL
jgi:hypothetical protein